MVLALAAGMLKSVVSTSRISPNKSTRPGPGANYYLNKPSKTSPPAIFPSNLQNNEHVFHYFGDVKE
jgi:hypothetical protein